MSFNTYNRLFFVLLGVALVSLFIMFVLALLSSQTRKEEKKALATFALTSVASAFLANAVCGIQHKKMRAKGGISSLEESGRSFYFFDIPINLGIAMLGFVTAVRTWYGLVQIFL